MVATSTIIAIAINLLLGLVIPAVLYVVVKKKFAGERKAFFIGCAIMFGFAFVLESFVHSIVLGGSLGKTITGNIWLYALYGGAMAALFEETGRFVAFRFFLKNHENDGNALLYGAGHGGFEAFYLLFFSGINNLAFALMLNGGGAEALTAGLTGDALLQIEATIDQMQNLSWWVFLLSPIERLAAIVIHLSLSVIVWFGVKERNYALVGLSMLLHFGVDFVTVILNQMFARFGSGGMLLTEAAVWIMAAGCAAVGMKLWKEKKSKVPEGATPA